MNTESDFNTFKVREWRPICDAPNYYVRSDGVIASRKSGKMKRLRPWLTHDGYRQHYIAGRKLYAHQIVLRTFVGPPPTPDHVCDHLDFDRTHNAVENLRWLDRYTNTRRTPMTAHLFS